MQAVLPVQSHLRSTVVFPGTLRAPRSIQPNGYDACLLEEYRYLEYISDNGGLSKICCPRGKKPYRVRPWVAMPAEGRRFKPIGVLPVPDLTNPANLNVDIPVMTMTVSKGYKCVLTDVVCEITANGDTGFVEGSGTLTWRLKCDTRLFRDLGNINTTLGSLVTPTPVPRGSLLANSDNVITWTVAFSNAAFGTINPVANIICSITGWLYPF